MLPRLDLEKYRIIWNPDRAKQAQMSYARRD